MDAGTASSTKEQNNARDGTVVERGILFIFNFLFDDGKVQDRRKGTMADESRLREVFGSRGFEVHVYTDLNTPDDLSTEDTCEKVKKIVEHLKALNRKPDFICVAVMSHGTNKVAGVVVSKSYKSTYIATSDGGAVDFRENFYKVFKEAKELEQINKLFLVQACRGGKREVEHDGPGRVYYDNVIFYATSDGFAATRFAQGEAVEGSHFIQTLCDQLAKDETDLRQVMVQTRDEVIRKYKNIEQPDFHKLFRETIYLAKPGQIAESPSILGTEICCCALHP